MPVDRRVFLVGPPGTGKTTTLIRRLAQKRMEEALTDDEREVLARAGLSESFTRPDSWVMFSPTELLKLYLRDAFNRESVPASRDNLRTWDKERTVLARGVFKILSSADSDGFLLDESLVTLTDSSSEGIIELFGVFSRV